MTTSEMNSGEIGLCVRGLKHASKPVQYLIECVCIFVAYSGENYVSDWSLKW